MAVIKVHTWLPYDAHMLTVDAHINDGFGLQTS